MHSFPPSDFRLLRFWSDDFPHAKRVGAWTEVLSRMLLKAEVEALTEAPFQVDASLRALPGVHFGAGLWGPSVTRRTAQIAAADPKGFYLIVNTEGLLRVRTEAWETMLEEGDGAFLSCAQEVSVMRPERGRLTCARVDPAQFRFLVPDADDCGGQIIRRGNEAMRALTTYLRDLDDKQGLTDPELRGLVVSHIFSLVALTLNTARDAVRASSTATPAAARLRAIKQYAAERLADQELTIARVAAANRLSPRQLQRLFEADDTTFSEFLLRKRLENVHAVLIDPRQAHRSVSDIALASGFGDVSYFNRAFRAHYGASPTAIRQAAAGSA